MINNNISNMRRIVAALFLLWTGAANSEDGLGVAVGFQLGVHGFTGVSNLCLANTLCTYENTALTAAPYLRLGLSPEHSVVAAYRHGDNQEVVQTRILAGTVAADFSVRTTSLAYEYRPPVGMPDLEAFLKVGYHNSKFHVPQADDSESFSGILLGGGFVVDEQFIVGYEYFDADDLDGGHYIYLGVEFGL